MSKRSEYTAGLEREIEQLKGEIAGAKVSAEYQKTIHAALISNDNYGHDILALLLELEPGLEKYQGSDGWDLTTMRAAVDFNRGRNAAARYANTEAGKKSA